MSLRESALLNIIKEMAKAGQFDQAIKVSQEIKDPYKRCQGLFVRCGSHGNGRIAGTCRTNIYPGLANGTEHKRI
ncbi:hypothetical protein [Acetomicrobium sp.]|uniref:hypothetical protein n=1 Tax=Acetomicrobium sp. TaxID=1872099 RepID=UPI001BCFC066|nr:hypothetical protein [Acetomicrobium sp.]